MKVLVLNKQGKWELQSCYYFGTNLDANGIDTLEEYLAFSTNFAAHIPEPMTSCQNTIDISYL